MMAESSYGISLHPNKKPVENWIIEPIELSKENVSKFSPEGYVLKLDPSVQAFAVFIQNFHRNWIFCRYWCQACPHKFSSCVLQYISSVLQFIGSLVCNPATWRMKPGVSSHSFSGYYPPSHAVTLRVSSSSDFSCTLHFHHAVLTCTIIAKIPGRHYAEHWFWDIHVFSRDGHNQQQKPQ